MSSTYSLVCDDCKEKFWVGQDGRFYNGDHVALFLHAHIGCHIRYLCDQADDDQSLSYEEIIAVPDLNSFKAKK